MSHDEIKSSNEATKEQIGATIGAQESPRQATFGFNQEGYFVLQVPKEMGSIGIIGFMTRAIHFINIRMDITESQKASEEKRSLVKPNGKGFGVFNLFRK